MSFAHLSKEDFTVLYKNKDKFKKMLMNRMKNDKTYSNSFSNATGRRDNVKRRFSVFESILKDCIH